MNTTTATPTKRRRFSAGLALVGSGLALLATPSLAGAQVQADDVAPYITVTQTPSGNVADCVPANLAVLTGNLTAFPQSTASEFKLTINTQAPLCEPLTFQAVVYKMPPTDPRWPQTLVESKTVTITEAGDTVITFAKQCDPVQFDVITGEAPQVINSGLESQLLFPGNLETANQWLGKPAAECNGATTTSAPTTTETPSTSVLGSTTIATVPQSVLSATTTPGTSPTASVEGTNLAATGATSMPFTLIGGGLVLVGIALSLAARRRV